MSFDEQTKTYRDWLISRGVEINDKLAFKDYRSAGQGRGVEATADIKEGEVLFSIPASALLVVASNEKFAELADEYDLDEWSALIVYMMAASADKTWKPYFDVLPTKFNTPIFWTAEQLEKLEPSPIHEQIGREDADELYDALKESVLQEDLFKGVDTSREAFHRMGSLIMAYAFDVFPTGEEDEETVKAMVPLADLLNAHTRKANAHLEVPEGPNDKLEMTATADIKAGEQVFNTYGELASGELLRRYGYVEAGGTDFEAAELELETLIEVIAEQKKLPLKQVQKRADKLAQLGPDVFDDAFEIAGVPTDELICVVDALASDLPPRQALMGACDLADEGILTPEGKQALSAALEKRLARYPDARKLPESETLVYTDVDNMIEQVFDCERELLKYALNWVKESSPVPARKPKHK